MIQVSVRLQHGSDGQLVLSAVQCISVRICKWFSSQVTNLLNRSDIWIHSPNYSPKHSALSFALFAYLWVVGDLTAVTSRISVNTSVIKL
jgi:hypothetical protein